MKIAVFIHYLPPHVGGIEAVAESQIMGLAAAGEDVSVITSACSAKSGVSELSNCSIRRLPAWNYFEDKMKAVFPIFSPALVWHGYNIVKRADVVHAHDAFYLTSFIAAFWARLLRKPLILTQHVDMVPHPRRIVNLAQRAVYATTGRFIFRSSRRIVVLNSRVREFLIARGVDASIITFLPNGVDTHTFTPPTDEQRRALRRRYNLPDNGILALFAGRFAPKKGFAELLKLEAIRHLQLVFAGGNAPAGHARGDQHFLGVVSRRDMPDVFRLCDIFVLPSQGEGFPVTVQEAMASGLPIIMGGDPAYEPYGLNRSLVKLIEPDSEKVRLALQAAVADSGLRLNMSAYSRRYALEYFDRDKHIAELISIYKSLTCHGSGKRSAVTAFPMNS